MRLLCGKSYKKCLLLLVVVLLTVWMLVQGPARNATSLEGDHHSMDILQSRSLPSWHGLQPPSTSSYPDSQLPSPVKPPSFSIKWLQTLQLYPKPSSSSPFSSVAPQALKHSNCRQSHCAEVLSRTDKMRQRACLSEILKASKNKVTPQEMLAKISDNDCNFMEGKKRAPVALVSAEGSGNTWVRGLLEKASGFCTGFNFCDYVMRKKGFVGENVNSGSVLVVKTHMKLPQWIGLKSKLLNKFEAKYGSAIFLLRNPYYSLIAEWNRRLTNEVLIKQNRLHNESHVNVAPAEIWYSNSWDKFLHSYMSLWVERIQNWVLVQSPNHPVIVVRYEDLKEDTGKEVARMLSFLHIHVSPEDLSLKLREDFTTFKRPHGKAYDFERYTPDQKVHIRSTVQQAMQLAEEKNMAEVLNLKDYLMLET